MPWLELGLGLIKLANYCLGLAHDRQQFNAGYDKAVAESALKTLQMTKSGRDIMAKLDPMTEAQLNNVADELGKS